MGDKRKFVRAITDELEGTGLTFEIVTQNVRHPRVVVKSRTRDYMITYSNSRAFDDPKFRFQFMRDLRRHIDSAKRDNAQAA